MWTGGYCETTLALLKCNCEPSSTAFSCSQQKSALAHQYLGSNGFQVAPGSNDYMYFSMPVYAIPEPGHPSLLLRLTVGGLPFGGSLRRHAAWSQERQRSNAAGRVVVPSVAMALPGGVPLEAQQALLNLLSTVAGRTRGGTGCEPHHPRRHLVVIQ